MLCAVSWLRRRVPCSSWSTWPSSWGRRAGPHRSKQYKLLSRYSRYLSCSPPSPLFFLNKINIEPMSRCLACREGNRERKMQKCEMKKLKIENWKFKNFSRNIWGIFPVLRLCCRSVCLNCKNWSWSWDMIISFFMRRIAFQRISKIIFYKPTPKQWTRKFLNICPPPPDIDGMKLLQAYPQCQEVLSAPFSTQLFPFPMFTFPFTFTCIRQS